MYMWVSEGWKSCVKYGWNLTLKLRSKAILQTLKFAKY